MRAPRNRLPATRRPGHSSCSLVCAYFEDCFQCTHTDSEIHYINNFFFSFRESAEDHTGPTTAEEPSQPSSSSPQHDSRGTDEDQQEPQPSTSTERSRNDEGENAEKEEGEKDEAVEAVLTEEDLIQQSQAEYDSGRYSPALLTSSELPLDSHTITLEEDMHRLQLARRQLQVTGTSLSGDKQAILRRFSLQEKHGSKEVTSVCACVTLMFAPLFASRRRQRECRGCLRASRQGGDGQRRGSVQRGVPSHG